MTELLAWSGTLFFSICGLPQAYQCYKQKHADGLSRKMLLFWLCGNISYLIYTYLTQQWILCANYTINLGVLAIIWYYVLNPVDKTS